MSDPSDSMHRRLQLVSGKGGVGKTTVAIALALEAAREGRRPLVLELGHRSSVRAIVDDRTAGAIGFDPVEIAPGVHAMNASHRETLMAYVSRQLRSRRLGRAVVDSRGLSRFFHAAPGVVEVATFALVHRLVTARKPHWDPVIVDLDATGHAVMMLELPTVLDAIVGEGPLRTLLDRTSGLLRDPARTAMHLVTLPASLPVDETLELYERLAGAGVAALGSVIVNRMPLARFTDDDAEVLESLARDAVARRDDGLAADVALGRRALASHRHAAEQRRRVDCLALPVFELPEVCPGESARLDLEAIATLGRCLRAHPAEAVS